MNQLGALYPNAVVYSSHRAGYQSLTTSLSTWDVAKRGNGCILLIGMALSAHEADDEKVVDLRQDIQEVVYEGQVSSVYRMKPDF